MVFKKVFLIFCLTVPAWADTGFNIPAVVVSTDTAKAKTYGIQRLILSSGTTLSVSGSNATISTDKTTISSMTVSSQLNVSQIKWQAKTNMMLYPDGVTIMSLPGAQETFFGYNTNLSNSGGLFNTSYGATAMPYPSTGNFNTCIGNSCMSGALLTGENNNSMGYGALSSLSSGFYNNCMGGSSCNLLATASNNTGVGAYSLQSNVAGDSNSALGLQSLMFVTGAANIGMGYQASVSTDTANASGGDDHTIFIGVQSGRDLVKATTLTNAGAIGYGAYVSKSNQFQLGGKQGSGREWTVLTSTLSVANHYNNAGKVSPVVSACGVTPSGSVVGYDSAGTITVGGGVVTSCTLTFATAWTNIPTCVVSDNSTTVPGDISSLSTTAVTFGFSTSLGGGKIYFICVGSDS